MKKLLLLLMALLLTTTMVACGGDGDGRNSGKGVTVNFWMYGDSVEIAVYDQLVKEFNKANEGVIRVKLQDKASDEYFKSLELILESGGGPDLFYVQEQGFKSLAEDGYLYDLTSFVNSSTKYVVSDMWESAQTRFQYDTNTRTVDGPNKRFYAVPKDIGPTVIFYNETLFNKSNVNVISVAKEDLAAFNSNTKADDRGKLKSAYGIQCEVKEKGYFVDTNGQKWFNNQIAMNWEEVVSLSNVLQDNNKDIQGFNGFFTEWWFNYGWSVGGDCIQYIQTDNEGNGYWDFTLMDDTANYIVADDAAPFTINGNTYQPGEIISYQDKLVDEAPTIPGKKDTKVKTVEPTVLAAVESGQLKVLPSQRTAFVEFVRLGSSTTTVVDSINGVDLKGYGITPSPTSIGTDAAKGDEFTSGKLGMLVDGRWNVTTFREKMNGRYSWDVAPLPIYKEYDENGDVSVHGVAAGHSGSIGVALNKNTKNAEAAWKFLEYIGGEYGQSVQSKTGFAIPLQKHLANNDEIFLQSNQSPRNSKIFIDAAATQKAGDWWYLRDNAWITDWAEQLNYQVRNGKMSLSDFYNCSEYNKTYELLLAYTKKK